MNEVQKKYLILMRTKAKDLTEKLWDELRNEPSKVKQLNILRKHWKKLHKELRKLNDQGIKELAIMSKSGVDYIR